MCATFTLLEDFSWARVSVSGPGGVDGDPDNLEYALHASAASGNVSGSASVVPNGLGVPAIFDPSKYLGQIGAVLRSQGGGDGALQNPSHSNGNFEYSGNTEVLYVRYILEGTWDWNGLEDPGPGPELNAEYVLSHFVLFERSNNSLPNAYSAEIRVSGFGSTDYPPPYNSFLTVFDIPDPGDDPSGGMNVSNIPSIIPPQIRGAFWLPIYDGDLVRFGAQGEVLANNTSWSSFAGIGGSVVTDAVVPTPQLNDTTPPRISDVIVSSSVSGDAPFHYSLHDGSTDQMQPAMVRGADTISIEFTEPVMVLEGDLELVGMHTGVRPQVEAFSVNGNVATWVFSAPFAADEFQITLSDFVHDGSMNFLDGEWTNSSDTFSSGNSIEGGNFEFIFNPAPLAVTTADDNFDGDFSYGHFSLREALYVAANLTGADTITFASGVFATEECISLQYDSNSDNVPDQLVVNSSVTVAGPGASLLAISGNEQSRVIYVNGDFDVTFKGLTIKDGKVTGAIDGGGIYNEGNLTLDSVVVTNNQTQRRGGGVYNYNGTVHFIDSTIADNSADNGGGIASRSYKQDAIFLQRSAVIGNQATYAAGAFLSYDSGVGDRTARIENSTFSGNSATSNGGAITVNLGVSVTITNSTITLNTSGGVGGGVRNSGSSITLHNTIVANNNGSSDYYDDWADNSAQATSSSNLIGIGGSINLSSGGAADNQVGSVLGPLSPGLTSLGDYGGPTKTHALISTSPAIDRGNNSKRPTGVDLDQRGFARVVDGPAVGASVDIGAFEYGAPIIVSTIVDESDMNFGSGDLSLREALLLSQASDGLRRIAFDPSLVASPVTIYLSQSLGSLVVEDGTIIAGPGSDILTIDGNADASHRYPVFDIDDYAIVEISGLTVTGGHGYNTAGGIHSQGYLTLSEVRVSGNIGVLGGGVGQLDGSLAIYRSEIDGNEATMGGGVYMYSLDGGLLVDSSSIHHNSATTGGGMYLSADILITNSTISTNSANSKAGLYLSISESELDEGRIINVTVTANVAITGEGAGVYSDAEVPIIMHNTIVAQNFSGTNESDVYGSFDSGSSHNLIGWVVGSSGLQNGTGTIAGYPGLGVIDAKLLVLSDYGGSTPSHVLHQDSPAIDAGNNSIATYFGLMEDQRGLDRQVDWGDDGIQDTVDIGAIELAVAEIWS